MSVPDPCSCTKGFTLCHPLERRNIGTRRRRSTLSIHRTQTLAHSSKNRSGSGAKSEERTRGGKTGSVQVGNVRGGLGS